MVVASTNERYRRSNFLLRWRWRFVVRAGFEVQLEFEKSSKHFGKLGLVSRFHSRIGVVHDSCDTVSSCTRIGHAQPVIPPDQP